MVEREAKLGPSPKQTQPNQTAQSNPNQQNSTPQRQDAIIQIEPITITVPQEVFKKLIAPFQKKKPFPPYVNAQTRSPLRKPTPKKYKVPIPFVWAQFVDDEKIIEIAKRAGLKEHVTETLLCDLSEPEYMAINALLVLFEENKKYAKEERDYAGEIKEVVTSPILVIPETAFYRAFYSAYGLRKTKRGYDKKAKMVALEALKKLDEKKYLIPLRVVGKSADGKKKITLSIIKHARLVTIDSEAEYKEETKEKVLKRINLLILKLHWILTYKVDNFYALRRRDKNAIIAKHTNTRKEFYSVLRLTDFLETLDINPVSFSEQRLAQIIGCKSLYKERKKKQLREKIERTLELTKKAGWINEYRRDGDTYILKLNPELCCRVERKNELQNTKN